MTKHSSPNQPNQLLLRGNDAFRAGNLEQARQYYRKALALAPEHPDCWINPPVGWRDRAYPRCVTVLPPG